MNLKLVRCSTIIPIMWIGVCVTILFPKVHNERLGLSGIKEQVIVSAPCCLYFLPVFWLIMSLMRPVTLVSSANLIIVLEPCIGLQSWVKRDYRKGLSIKPWGMPVISEMAEEVMLFNLLVRKFSIQLHRKVLLPKVTKFSDQFRGYDCNERHIWNQMDLVWIGNETKFNKQHSCILVLFIQVC